MFDKSVHILKEMTLNSAFTDCLQLFLVPSLPATRLSHCLHPFLSVCPTLSSLSVRLSASVLLLFCYQGWLPAYTMYIFIKVTLNIKSVKCVIYGLGTVRPRTIR